MHLVLEPRAMPHDLVAPRHQPTLAFRFRVRRPDLRQVPGRLQAGERAGVDLVGLDVSLGDRLHLQRIGDNHPCHERRQNPRHHAVGGRFDHHLITGQQGLAKSLQRSPRHIDAARMSEPAILPNHHLPESSVDVDANHPSHSHLLPIRPHDGSYGRHDNYGFALSAQPGESQRRPATNSSSRLIVCIGLPAPSCSRCLCPDGRTIRYDVEHRSGTLAPRNLIPVTNPIERLNGVTQRRTEVAGIFPNENAVVRLIGAILLEQNEEWAIDCARYDNGSSRAVAR